ncbi:hypothetical protein ACVWWK_006734 [Bradyrhizobium sp. LB9.1b]
MPPSAERITLRPDIIGLFAFVPLVMAELAPVALTVVVPERLLIGPLTTMPEFEVTRTVLLPPPLNEMLIGFDALTVLVSVSVR